MRTRFCLTCIVFLLALPAPAAWGQPPDTPEEGRRAIEALLQKAEDANNAGDIEGWVALFAADAVYMAPGAPPVTTLEGLTEMAQAGFRNQTTVDIQPVEIRICGDWAFARTHVSGTVKLHDTGKIVPVDVKEMAIFRREPGREWKIARLINNSNTE